MLTFNSIFYDTKTFLNFLHAHIPVYEWTLWILCSSVLFLRADWPKPKPNDNDNKFLRILKKGIIYLLIIIIFINLSTYIVKLK